MFSDQAPCVPMHLFFFHSKKIVTLSMELKSIRDVHDFTVKFWRQNNSPNVLLKMDSLVRIPRTTINEPNTSNSKPTRDFVMPFPRLRHCRVRISDAQLPADVVNPHEMGENILYALTSSNEISDVLIEGLSLDKDLPFKYVKLPWTVKSLALYFALPLADKIEILKDCPLLAQCDLSFAEERRHYRKPEAFVRHLHLKTLVIWSLEILAYLTSPALEHLSIRVLHYPVSLTLLSNFIARSRCSLKTLSLPLMAPFSDDILECLLELETLFIDHQCSTVDESMYPKDFIPALAQMPTTCLPRLKRFTISLPTEVGVDTSPLVHMPEFFQDVMAVIRARKGLKSFEIYFNGRGQIKETVVNALCIPHSEELREWIEGGMQINVYIKGKLSYRHFNV
jgi:hypothetical protein